VSEMNASFQELTHGEIDRGHCNFLLRLILRKWCDQIILAPEGEAL
jgi:hypothetical protein